MSPNSQNLLKMIERHAATTCTSVLWNESHQAPYACEFSTDTAGPWNHHTTYWSYHILTFQYDICFLLLISHYFQSLYTFICWWNIITLFTKFSKWGLKGFNFLALTNWDNQKICENRIFSDKAVIHSESTWNLRRKSFHSEFPTFLARTGSFR